MAYDVSTEINTIINSTDRDEVRESIADAFEKVINSSIGLTISSEEWDSLSAAEKDNGEIYFASDVKLEFTDGDNLFFTNNEENTEVLVSYSTLKEICDIVRTYNSISGGVYLTDVPELISVILAQSASSLFLNKIERRQSKNYCDGSVWKYVGEGTGIYTYDLYKIKNDSQYIFIYAGVPSDGFYLTTFTDNPFEESEDTPFVENQYIGNAKYTTFFLNSTVDGYALARVSGSNSTEALSFAIDITNIMN